MPDPVPAPYQQPPTPFSGGGFSGLQLGQGGAYVYSPPPEHLVSGQLRQLQSRSNPLVQRARADALRRANARGDINASYAAGAAEGAAFDAMMPVAMQDSATLTRVHMQNAQNAQDRAIAEANANAARGGDAIGATLAAAERDNAEAARNLQLQLQRERLAFEGEQAGYGREHDVGMFERALGRDLTLGERNFLQQMALNEQGFGFTRQLGEDEYGRDIGRMGYEWARDRDLTNQQGDWQSRILDQQNQYNIGGFQRGFFQNIIMSGISNPDVIGNPQAWDGLINFVMGAVPGSASNNFWNSLFGG